MDRLLIGTMVIRTLSQSIGKSVCGMSWMLLGVAVVSFNGISLALREAFLRTLNYLCLRNNLNSIGLTPPLMFWIRGQNEHCETRCFARGRVCNCSTKTCTQPVAVDHALGQNKMVDSLEIFPVHPVRDEFQSFLTSFWGTVLRFFQFYGISVCKSAIQTFLLSFLISDMWVVIIFLFIAILVIAVVPYNGKPWPESLCLNLGHSCRDERLHEVSVSQLLLMCATVQRGRTEPFRCVWEECLYWSSDAKISFEDWVRVSLRQAERLSTRSFCAEIMYSPVFACRTHVYRRDKLFQKVLVFFPVLHCKTLCFSKPKSQTFPVLWQAKCLFSGSWSKFRKCMPCHSKGEVKYEYKRDCCWSQVQKKGNFNGPRCRLFLPWTFANSWTAASGEHFFAQGKRVYFSVNQATFLLQNKWTQNDEHFCLWDSFACVCMLYVLAR